MKVRGPFVAVIATLGLIRIAAAQPVEPAPTDQPPIAAPNLLPPNAPLSPPPQAAPTAPPPAQPPDASPAAVPSLPPPPTAAKTSVFGAQDQFILSIERAVGIDYISQTTSQEGVDLFKTTETNFALFGPPSAGTFSAFSFPRAALDWFIVPNLSVGLGLGVIRGSMTITDTPPSGLPISESFTGLLAMPRAGYAWHLTRNVVLWPRAGLSVVYLKNSITNAIRPTGEPEGPAHYYAVTVEAPLVVTLLPRLALTVGPTLDTTFRGSQMVSLYLGSTTTNDQRVTELGFQAGLLFQL